MLSTFHLRATSNFIAPLNRNLSFEITSVDSTASRLRLAGSTERTQEQRDTSNDSSRLELASYLLRNSNELSKFPRRRIRFGASIVSMTITPEMSDSRFCGTRRNSRVDALGRTNPWVSLCCRSPPDSVDVLEKSNS